MQIGKILYLTKRSEWRKWLSKNHSTEPDIWLLFYSKSSGKPRLSYDDAVLEALCFGWIDSILKKVDTDSFAQRFSPRKKTSVLSQMNKERVRELIKKGKMTKVGLTAIAHAFNPKTDIEDEFTIPIGILKALKNNAKAWENFQKMPGSYQRIRVAYIESRKRHSTGMYIKALNNFIHATEKGKMIGISKK